MQILGKVQIQGKEKELVLKEEDGLFKYYCLDLVGVYTPKMPGQTIIFREDTVENRVLADAKDNQQKPAISPTEKEQIQQFLESIKIRDVIEKFEKQREPYYERTRL